MRLLSRLACCLAVTGAVIGSSAAPAWAPKYIFGASAFGTCDIEGSDGARFQGALTPLSFAASGDELRLTATIVGTCALDGQTVAEVDQAPYDVAVVSLTTDCARDHARLEVRPGVASVGGFAGKDPVKFDVDLYPSTVVEVDWRPGDPGALHGRLCAVDRIADNASTARLAAALNTLLLR